MEPIPETVEALRELTRDGDREIARVLFETSREVERIVPELVGLSLSLVSEDLTFTMSATSGPVAQLDGMQYLAGGPCEETLRTSTPHAWVADQTDERRWQLFARASAAAGIGSTLSLPVLDRRGQVVAGINLYASTPDAFDGRHEDLARACGAVAGSATTNADLDFTTRFEAARTPDRIRDERAVDQAVGVLMAQLGVDDAEAEERLRQAAQRAGLADAQMARAVLRLAGLDEGKDVGDDQDG